MIDFKYTLEKGSRKHICPECGKKTFVRYQEVQTGEYLPEIYGRCDKEIKCGYHHNPYADKYNLITARENSAIMQPRLKRRNKPQAEGELLPIPYNVLYSTFGGYDQNIFIQNLLTNVPFPFDSKDIERVIGQYYLGTIQSDYLAGAVTFPFIDSQGRVMAIQVKQFDHNNHANRTSFLHSMIEHETKEKGEPLPEWLKIYNNNEKMVSCLFGAHLLSKYPSNPVALVEAPKSAIYGALYFGLPKKSTDLLWLAVFNLSSLTLEKCEALRGRRVILFPDLSKDGEAFKKWSQKAREHKERLKGTQFVLSDLSQGRIVQDIRYYGGSVYNGQRCISIGRHCALFYDIPWRIVDVRHTGVLFKQAHGDRLGYSALKTFNRALHSLIQKGAVSPVPAEMITQGLYKGTGRIVNAKEQAGGNIRFVVMNSPDAFSTP